MALDYRVLQPSYSSLTQQPVTNHKSSRPVSKWYQLKEFVLTRRQAHWGKCKQRTTKPTSMNPSNSLAV